MELEKEKSLQGLNLSSFSSASSQNNSLDKSCRNNSSKVDISDYCDKEILEMLDQPFNLIDNSKLRSDENYYGFDNNTGDSWIYPTNFPVRQYQFNISRISLFRNTLVVLPTGLGKTFIAAVVMYNIYRWYPTGKVIFMAPTRPLVAQQIDACYKIMGISPKDTVEMTGKQTPSLRAKMWKDHRVFFVTPQIVHSDLNAPDQFFPMNDIRLVVVDEAHRAKGKYAYVEVIQAIASRNKMFRVLALSATPGRRIEDVAEVVKNLLISHIEVRWENSIDVLPYTFKKKIQIVVVPLDDRIKKIRNEFIEILDPYVRYLLDNNVISGSVTSLNKNWLLMEHKRFREMSLHQRHPEQSNVTTNFNTCISLYHALELLDRHGINVFLNFFDDANNSTEEKYFVSKDARLKELLNNVRSQVGINPFTVCDETLPNGLIPEIPDDLDFGHPKYYVLQQNLIDFFEKATNSKAIIFCEFRESVFLVHRLLLKHRPLIRPKKFVGQGSSIGIRGVTQKQQIAAMQDFRAGVCNVLIATCVAEEGIDVGEVDLIVCFDTNTKNPTRLVQRIGRTGRKRQGKVIMLATEGKEHDILKEVLASKDKINQKISKNSEISSMLYKHSPHMVPPEFNPKCIETFIKIEEEKPGKTKTKKTEKPSISTKEVRRSKRVKANNQIHEISSQDVRQFFKKIPPILDKDEKNIFCSPNIAEKSIDLTEDIIPNNKSVKEDEINVTIVENDSNKFIDSVKSIRKFLLSKSLECKNKKKSKQPTIRDILLDENCPIFIKKITLEANPQYVEDTLKKISEIDIDKNNEKELIIINEDSNDLLNKELVAMEAVLGDIDNIKNSMLFNKRKIQQINAKERKYWIINNDNNLINLCEENNNKHIDLECLEKLNTVENSIINNKYGTVSNLFGEGTQLTCPQFIENESKYRNEDVEINDNDTPIKVNKEIIYLKPVSINKLLSDSKYIQSPLMRAFENSCKKKKNSDFFSPVTVKNIKLKDRMTLEYFGLTNYDELFVIDDHDEAPDLTIVDKKSFPRKLFHLSDNSDDDVFCDKIMKSFELDHKIEKKVEDNIILHKNENKLLSKNVSRTSEKEEIKLIKEKANNVKDETVYTMSQIINHVNEIEKQLEVKGNDDLSPSNTIKDDIKIDSPVIELSNKYKTTKIDLGNLEEIFGSSDDDLIDDSQKENIIKQITKDEFFKQSNDLFDETLFHEINDNIMTTNNKSPHVKRLEINEEKSPSVMSRKPNMSRLRLLQTKSQQSIFNENKESASEDSKSQFFITCFSKTSNVNDTINLTKPIVEKNEFIIEPSQIAGASLKNKRIIKSSQSDEESDVFETCPSPTPLKSVRDISVILKKKQRKLKNTKRRNMFIDCEAGVSGDESSDENEEGQSRYLIDSMFVNENDYDEDCDDNVDIHAEYLKSIRSPLRKPGAFKIPDPSKYINMENIFSQPIHDEDSSIYKDNSFVVEEDEVIEDSEEELCPLEKAEAILKQRRKQRKQNINDVKSKKRKKILILHSDSSDDGMESLRKKIKSNPDF